MVQTQFLLVCIHSSQLLFIDCDYPMMFAYWIGLYAIVFLVLFANFYVQAYRKPAAPPGGAASRAPAGGARKEGREGGGAVSGEEQGENGVGSSASNGRPKMH